MQTFRAQIVDMLPRLRRFAVTLCGNLADADDLLQATVEKALRRQESYKTGLRLDSWLFKIMQNHWIDEKRKLGRRGVTVAIEEQHSLIGENGVETQEHRQAAQKLLAIVATLPEPQQLVVACILVDGQTYEETAAMLDIPVGTVMSRLFRARKTLQGFAGAFTGEQSEEPMPG